MAIIKIKNVNIEISNAKLRYLLNKGLTDLISAYDNGEKMTKFDEETKILCEKILYIL